MGKIDLDWGGETKSKNTLLPPFPPQPPSHSRGEASVKGATIGAAKRTLDRSTPAVQSEGGGKGLLAMIATNLLVLLGHFSHAESGV